MRDIFFFKIEMAGKLIEVECFNKYVFYICRDYLAKFEQPDFIVKVAIEDIRDEAARKLGRKIEYNDSKTAVEYPDAEASVVLHNIADCLIDANILLIHGAAIAVNHKCFIFTAPSGIGKTTHIQNWIKKIPGTIVINGDKPFVDVENKLVYGSPWCGKEGMNTNSSASLGGIIALERGDNNTIRRSSFNEIFPVLLQQTYIPNNALRLKSIQLLSRLKDIPCYKLKCNMNEDAALVAYSGLFDNHSN